jgi:hypothetical protein
MADYRAEILIDDEVVWSSETEVAQQTITIDVSEYTDKHDVKFRIVKLTDESP